jgi:hypothetical protein
MGEKHDIIIITGACGVGKTTTAIEWAKRKKGAIVECDWFTEWIFNSKICPFSIEEEMLVAKLACSIANEYLHAKMDVAIDYVFTPDGLKYIQDYFMNHEHVKNIRFVWLYCDILENHRRDGSRSGSAVMGRRVDIVNQQLKNCNWPDEVLKINTTGLTLIETVNKIVSYESIQ